MARTWVLIESRTRASYAAGSRSRRTAASSRLQPAGMYPSRRSCAEVWSVTTSGTTPRRTSSGSTSATFPTNPTESGRRAFLASSSSARARGRVGLQPVAIAGVHPAPDPALVHVHTEEGGPVHRRGQRLGATHAAEAAGHHQAPLERAAEMLPSALREGLVGPLQDSLGADVDPRAGRHLAVHRQAERLQPAELVPGGPSRHQMRVGDQHAGRLRVGPEHPHGLPALDQQRLVVLQPAERGDDALVGWPVSGGLPTPAVDHQVVRPLGDRRIEVVHQHPERGLLVPALAGERRAGRGVDG